VNVPILALALVLIITNYRETPREAAPLRFDFPGMSLFSLAVGLFVVGMGIGSRHAAWNSPLVLGLLGGVLLVSAGFVLRERSVAQPFVPLRFLAMGPFATSALIIMAGFSAFIGVMVFTPAYVQGVRGESVQSLGFYQVTVVIGWFVTAAFGAKLVPRIGARVTALTGVIVTLAGLAFLNTWSLATPPSVIVATLLLCGAGMGFTQPSMFVMGQTALPPADQGLASGLLGVSVNLGTTISSAAYGTILTWSLWARGGKELVDRVPQLMQTSERAAEVVSAYDASLHNVFASKFAPALIALVLLIYALARWGRGVPANRTE
jgi:MFS family permease